MEHQNSRIIVYPSDICRLWGLKDKAGYRKYHEIKLIIGLGPKSPLTIFHLARHLTVTVAELEEKLFPKPPIYALARPAAYS